MPYYLSIGVSWEQFWHDDPKICTWYRNADDLRKKRINEQLWLSGVYVSEALASTVGNMFSKNNQFKYPDSPLPITKLELEEKREKEKKEKMERIKAEFTAKALMINSMIRGEESE